MTRYWDRARWTLTILGFSCGLGLTGQAGIAQATEQVKALQAPRSALPSEEQSRGVKRFSFIVYGDTRDGMMGLSFSQIIR